MKIQDLLTDESKWTKGRNARDAQGNGVASRTPEAAAWCLQGAMWKCYGNEAEAIAVAHKMAEALPPTGRGELDDGRDPFSELVNWNDLTTTTFSDVRRLVTELDI